MMAQPVGGLRYAANEIGQWPDTSLPGDPDTLHGPYTFINKDLNLATLDRILGDSKGLVIRPETFELVDGNTGLSFNERFTSMKSKTAMVTIDFGEARPPETYLVSTHYPGYDGLPAAKALERLHLDCAVGSVPWNYLTRNGSSAQARMGQTKQGITRVLDVATRSDVGGYWIMSHSWFNGRENVTRDYHPLVNACDFDNIILKADHALRLVYFADQDRDGLGIRTEKLLGTNYTDPDKDWDTDGDGISDLQEIRDGTDPTRNNFNLPPKFDHVVLDVRGTKVLVTAAISDEDDSLARATLSWSLDGRQMTVTANDPSKLAAELDLPLGTHTLTLVAVDARGIDSVLERQVDIVFPEQGLLAYYPISGGDPLGRDSYGNANVGDASGNERHAKYTLPHFATDRFGQGEQCADLRENGGSSYYGSIWCPPIPFETGSFTMAVWVNAGSLQSQRIIGPDSWFGLFTGNDSRVRFGIPADRNGSRFQDGIGVEDPETRPGNQWLFYAGVCQSGASSKTTLGLYFNSELVVEKEFDRRFESDSTNSAIFFIGNYLSRRANKWPEKPSETRLEAQKFQGMIDDVRIYNRALTPAEVQALYYERGYTPTAQ
jgi:hypothetical protein